jgi:hypothetical protein
MACPWAIPAAGQALLGDDHSGRSVIDRDVMDRPLVDRTKTMLAAPVSKRTAGGVLAGAAECQPGHPSTASTVHGPAPALFDNLALPFSCQATNVRPSGLSLIASAGEP